MFSLKRVATSFVVAEGDTRFVPETPDNKQQQSDIPFVVSERSDPIFRLHFGDSLNVFIVRALKAFEGKNECCSKSKHCSSQQREQIY